MSDGFEYYRVSASNASSIPLLKTDTGCPRYLYSKKPVENPEILKLALGKPIPKKPQMADYHSLPSSVISKRIYDVLNPMKVDGIQLLPAMIKGKDITYENYWGIHIYNQIKCVDLKLSDCTIDESGMENVKKIVLDKDILKKIPLKNRLIFRLVEDTAYQLFHKSIVDAIMAVNPTGIKFTNIEKWNEGSFFED